MQRAQHAADVIPALARQPPSRSGATPVPAPDAHVAGGRKRLVIHTGVDTLLLAGSLYFTLAANRLFLGQALQERALAAPQTWGFALALVVLLASAALPAAGAAGQPLDRQAAAGAC